MLKEVRLANFKCFGSLELIQRRSPLNLLCGPYGMGKSTVIQRPAVLRQSFTSGELAPRKTATGR